MKGIVFDIQRFALLDGPGIRTTVFLKGCPLHCDWCHNPESQHVAPELLFNAEKCVQCMECLRVCPNNVHVFYNGEHQVVFENCRHSGRCVEACVNDALTLAGREMDIEQIIHIVGQDKIYYEESGGGVTISGGEPMVQFKFTAALLQEMRQLGVHTCLDTSGFASTEQYQQILPHVDMILFDYKYFEADTHLQLTGQSNSLIMQNFDFLYQSGMAMTLRCPLVPGINDSAQHLQSIADLSARYPKLLGVELLPYHDMGRAKAARVGKEYRIPVGIVPNGDVKKKWLEQLYELGCSKARIV